MPKQAISYEPPPKELWPTDEEYERSRGLEEQLKVDLLMRLRNGTLMAVGYVRPAHRGDGLVWIASDKWFHGQISWQNSELWIDSNRLFEIRVLSVPASTTLRSTSPVGLGGPSRREEIKAAYTALRVAGRIDFGRSLRFNLRRIQTTVHESADLTPSKKRGVAYEAVRKAIGEQFRSDQAATKA